MQATGPIPRSVSKLMAQDLFGFLCYKLDWINPNHANLSFCNFQVNLPMGCCDRASGIRRNSACWAPLWSSSSWQAYAWPTTFTGHVPNLGWLTGLDVWLLYNFYATLKYVLILTSTLEILPLKQLRGELISHLPPTGFFSARGWGADLLYCPCHRAGHRGRFAWVPLVDCQDASYSFNCIMSVFLTVSSSTILNHEKPLLTNLNQLELALFQSPICWEAVCSRRSWCEN